MKSLRRSAFFVASLRGGAVPVVACILAAVLLSACGIEGKVTLDGEGLEAVLVTLDGAPEVQSTSDDSGTYFLMTGKRGLLTLRPRLHGFDFDPPYRRVLNLSRKGIVRGVDFEAQLHEFSDEEIFDLAYSDYKYPDAFYHEDLGGASIFYETTTSITSRAEREPVRIELCTDDYEQAYAWSELSDQNSSPWHRPVVGESENEKYFEFERVSETFPSYTLLSRIHKCSYVDRSMYDRINYEFSPGEIVVGIFNARPVNKTTVRELIEYLWFIHHYNVLGSKILRSYGVDVADAIEHTLLQTRFCVGDWGLCDAITLIESTYHVDKETGEIFAAHETLQTITGYCHPDPLIFDQLPDQ